MYGYVRSGREVEVPFTPARLSRLGASFAALALVALLAASPASAAKRQLRPSSVGTRLITFDLRGIQPHEIRRATFSSVGSRHRLRRATVRRAARSGLLRLRRPSKLTVLRRPRLVIVTDSTRPRVAWRKPSPNSSVSGVLNAKNGKCRVRAADNVRVSRVDFYLNGKRIGRDRRAPYTCRWDTGTAMNGGHRLSAVAYDTARHTRTAAVAVVVRHSGPRATTPALLAPGWPASSSPPPPPAPPPPPVPPPPVPPPPAPPPVGQTLRFADEFNGSSLDTTKWSPWDSPGHAGNGLRRKSAISVSGGSLVVTAKMVNGQIVSGGMSHKSDYTYGRYEFRVRTGPDPSGTMSGVVLTWPKYQWSPEFTENDMYETGPLAARNQFVSFVHHGTSTSTQKAFHHDVDVTQWHTVVMDWRPNSLRIWRDGVLVWTITDPKVIPDVLHHVGIQLDARRSGQSLTQPVQMFVDYIRIYS